MAIIEITVTKAGNVSIETSGFKGLACKTATAGLEQALGIVDERRLKSEAMEEQTQLRVGQGG